MHKKDKNQFEALCKLASKENWCWNLYCTTCGHLHFRYAFSELAAGKSPEDSNWLIHGGNTHYSHYLGPLPRSYSEDQKEKLLHICKEANIASIARNCKFPDWLGYLGLVLKHMYTSSYSYKAVSSKWASQLKNMASPNSHAQARLHEVIEQENELLNIGDLEICENEIMSNNGINGMDQTPNLVKNFSEEYRKLGNLFGRNEVESKIGRMNEIYVQCETAWIKNLDRLDNTDVKYLLVAEAPPWSENDPTSYFYSTFKGPVCNSVWKAFFNEAVPNDVNEALTRLGKKGFLLLDSLPFSMKYETSHRKKGLYVDLIKCCKAYIDEQLNNQKIGWAKEVRLALAFCKNGEAIINAFPGGIDLPNGQTIKLCPFLIAADGSGFPNSKILRDIWCMDTNNKKRSPDKPGLDNIANKAIKKLIDAGVPHHEGITGLIQDLEFHYQTGQGKILSSLEQANLYVTTDVRIHSEEFNLNFRVGKQIFYYWASVFHPEDYREIMSEKISHELEKINSKDVEDGSPN